MAQEIIDVDKLINLVEARPALYMKNLKDYSDINIKKKLWEEICLEVYPNWGGLTPENKIQYGKDIQKKWQNLRTCFSREIKLQKNVKSGQAASKRRKYVFFERLLFLLPTIEQRQTESNFDEENDTNVENTEPEILGDDTDVSEAPTTPCRPSTSSNVSRGTKRKQKTDEFEAKLLEVLQTDKKEVDEDTHFVLSLVPHFKSMNEDEKFDAKIHILQILRNIKKNRVPQSIQQNRNIGMPLYSPSPVPRSQATDTSYQFPSNISHFTNNTQAIYSMHSQPPQYCSTPSPANTEDETAQSAQSFYSNFSPGSPRSDILTLE